MNRFGIALSWSVLCCLAVGVRADEPVKLPVDNEFLIKAATCNHAAITIGKMAENRASAQVKSFATHMVQEHQECYQKVADLLKTRKVGVLAGTEPDTKAAMKRLEDLKGTDFDREYLKWVIQEHRAGVPMLEHQVKAGKDGDINAFAKEGLVAIRKHLAKAEELAKNIGSK